MQVVIVIPDAFRVFLISPGLRRKKGPKHRAWCSTKNGSSLPHRAVFSLFIWTFTNKRDIPLTTMVMPHPGVRQTGPDERLVIRDFDLTSEVPCKVPFFVAVLLRVALVVANHIPQRLAVGDETWGRPIVLPYLPRTGYWPRKGHELHVSQSEISKIQAEQRGSFLLPQFLRFRDCEQSVPWPCPWQTGLTARS